MNPLARLFVTDSVTLISRTTKDQSNGILSCISLTATYSDNTSQATDAILLIDIHVAIFRQFYSTTVVKPDACCTHNYSGTHMDTKCMAVSIIM